MKFGRAIREAVWILLTEGSVSRQRLKHELGLLDDQFEALVDELVTVKRWAAESEPDLITWAGGVQSALSPPHTRPRPAEQHAKSHEHSSEGERRQLTVMFCDLAGSTALSTKLDPEDMNDLITAYQRVVTPIVQRFDGYVAKYMGDGILVYFGYPQAREKDAQRAILASLAVIEEIQSFRFKETLEISVRIGIATGTVVVGESIGEGDARERTVAGETPNLAARLQALAEPNGIVISEVTKDLADNAFEIQSLGLQQLKGIDGAVEVWKVTGEVQDEFEIEAAGGKTSAPLVGRRAELGLLTRAWQQSREGSGQVVTINGEAGIGKSRLVEAIAAQALSDGAVRVWLRCSPHHLNSALYPVISQLRRVMGWTGQDANDEKLAKMESTLARYKFPTKETVPLMATLHSIALPDGKYPELKLSPQQQRLDTLDAVLAWLLEEAESQPVIAIWEDLHWADPTTLELFEMMIEQCPTAPILNVATFRSEFTPTWPVRSHITPITLNRLERPEIESLILQKSKNKPLPVEVVDHIVERGDGVPLYVGELTGTILTSGALHETDDAYELAGPLGELKIPATLQDSLLARLDRAPLVREVAQLGSVFGREFAYELVNAVGAIDETALKDGLDRLVEEELLYKRGRLPRSKYMFKHALIQDAAYQSLLKRTRQHYHVSIAEMLMRQFPETLETQPEILAHHFTEAGNLKEASDYWLKAGQQALRRSENYEAIGHLKRGLAILTATPENSVRELAMLRQLGTAYMATKGYGAPETVETFDRARKLCGVVNDDSIYPVMFGVWLAALVRARHASAKEMISEMQELAANADDIFAPYAAHAMSAFTHLHTGELQDAGTYFEKGFAIQDALDPEKRTSNALLYGLDIEIANYAYGAWYEWLVGFPEKAIRLRAKAMEALEVSQQGYTQARGLYWCAVVNQFLGQWDEVARLTDQAIEIAKQHGLAMVASVCRILNIAADAALNESGDQADEIGEALNDYRATGARFQLPYHLTLQAELLLTGNRIDDGLKVIRNAQDLILETGEDYFAPEVLRLKGRLFAAGGSHDEARACFEQAIELAKSQGALSLQLRAATSMARLLALKGDEKGPRMFLKPVLNQFVEGFESQDFKEAESLLAAH
jgi:predicted ATPase/class 3 adenylate cyclase